MSKHTMLLLSTVFWGAALILFVLFFTKRKFIHLAIAFGLTVLGGIFKFMFKNL